MVESLTLESFCLLAFLTEETPCTCTLMRSSGDKQRRLERGPWTTFDQECCLRGPHQLAQLSDLTAHSTSGWAGELVRGRLGFQQSLLLYHSFKSDHSGFISARLHLSLTASLGFVPILFFSSCYLQMVFWGQIFSFSGNSSYTIYNRLTLTFLGLYLEFFRGLPFPIPPCFVQNCHWKSLQWFSGLF